MPSTTFGLGQALFGHCGRFGLASAAFRFTAATRKLFDWAAEAAARLSSRSRMARTGLGFANRGLAAGRPEGPDFGGVRKDDIVLDTVNIV